MILWNLIYTGLVWSRGGGGGCGWTSMGPCQPKWLYDPMKAPSKAGGKVKRWKNSFFFLGSFFWKMLRRPSYTFTTVTNFTASFCFLLSNSKLLFRFAKFLWRLCCNILKKVNGMEDNRYSHYLHAISILKKLFHLSHQVQKKTLRSKSYYQNSNLFATEKFLPNYKECWFALMEIPVTQEGISSMPHLSGSFHFLCDFWSAFLHIYYFHSKQGKY